MRKSCVQVVDSLLAGLGKLPALIHQVVFTSPGLGTNTLFLPNLYQLSAQTSTHKVLVNNRSGWLVIPTIHRTNGKGNKENTL